MPAPDCAIDCCSRCYTTPGCGSGRPSGCATRTWQLRAAGTGRLTTLQILELSGTPRQRGRQHGEELRGRIRELAERLLERGCSSEPVTDASLVGRLVRSTGFLLAVRRWTPHLLAEVEGIAEGAGLPFEVVFALNLADEDWAVGGSARDACTSLGLVSPFGGTVVAQNMDLPMAFEGQQTVLRTADRLILSYPGGLGLNAISAAGTAVCCNTLRQLRTDPDGLPVAFVMRGVIDQPDLTSAEAFLRRVRHASGQNYLVGDPTGVRWLWCRSGARWSG